MPLLLLASSLCTGRAVAAPRQVIGLAVLPAADADRPAAHRIKRAVQRAFGGDSEATLVDPLKVLTDRPLALDPETRKLLQQGMDALGSHRYRRAVKLLQRADHRAHARLSSVPKARLADLAVHLAAAVQGTGRRDRASKLLRNLLAWRPRHTLKLRVPAPPRWRQTADRARAWLDSAPTGRLRVTSVPRGALAFVDGRRAGATPCTMASLTEGPHYLTVQRPGYRRSVTRVEVRAGSEESVSITLHVDEPAHSVWQTLRGLRAQLGQARLQLPPELSRDLGIKTLLLLLVADPGRGALRVEGYLYRLETGRLLRRTALAVQPRAAAAQLQPLALWRASVPAAPGPTPIRRRRRAGPRWYERWWVWGVVGAVCAAGVALPLALTLGGDDGGPADRYRISW